MVWALDEERRTSVRAIVARARADDDAARVANVLVPSDEDGSSSDSGAEAVGDNDMTAPVVNAVTYTNLPQDKT